MIVSCSLNSGLAAYRDRAYEIAHASFIAELRVGPDGYPDAIPYAMNRLALAAAQSSPEQATRLHGAVDRLLEASGFKLGEPEDGWRADNLEQFAGASR